MDLNEKNKFARHLVRCPKCNKPIAEIRGNEIYVEKFIKGKPTYVKTEINHDAGGRFKITCDCGGYFATTVKTLGMTYTIKKAKP